MPHGPRRQAPTHQRATAVRAWAIWTELRPRLRRVSGRRWRACKPLADTNALPLVVAVTNRASAGKFTDIVVRDYSIYADSPMKILVLSRFDIFHLMSPEARASLQRSALGNVRESIEARALKSMAWEKYKKRFFNELEQTPKSSGSTQELLRSPGKFDRQSAELAKSLSAPVLQSTKPLPRALVDPGVIMLVCRRDLQPNHIGLGSPVSPSKLRDRQQLAAQPSKEEGGVSTPTTAHPTVIASPKGSDPIAQIADEADDVAEHPGESPNGPHLARSASMPSLDANLEQKPPHPDGTDKRTRTRSISRSPSCKVQLKVPHRRSTPDVVPETHTVEGSDALPAISPPGFKELAPPRIRAGHRRTSTQRSDKYDSSLHLTKGPGGSPSTGTPTIWDPVHGVCQPFAVVGFLKEVVPPRPMSSLSDTKPSKAGKPGDRKAPSEPVGAASGSSLLHQNGFASPSAVEITRFRVFGKLRDISDAMDLFRRVCAVETSPTTPDGADRSRFAIYKEAEMTMVLENFSTAATDSEPAARQFGASDLPQANGQRFACVGVTTAAEAGAPLSTVESVVVHVYQCFPTPQSAVRFARQASAALLSACAAYVVPLFEWVPLAEMERFDARNADLEQALEQVMLLRGGATHTSTWKARKDAMKRSGARHHRHHSPPS